jgi:hypothetical protein
MAVLPTAASVYGIDCPMGAIRFHPALVSKDEAEKMQARSDRTEEEFDPSWAAAMGSLM